MSELPKIVLRVMRPKEPEPFNPATISAGQVMTIGFGYKGYDGVSKPLEDFVADLPGEILLATDGGSVFKVMRAPGQRFTPCMVGDFLNTEDGDRYRVLGLAFVPSQGDCWQIIAERLQV